MLTVADRCIWHGTGTNLDRRQSATTVRAPAAQARECLAAPPLASTTLSGGCRRPILPQRAEWHTAPGACSPFEEVQVSNPGKSHSEGSIHRWSRALAAATLGTDEQPTCSNPYTTVLVEVQRTVEGGRLERQLAWLVQRRPTHLGLPSAILWDVPGMGGGG